MKILKKVWPEYFQKILDGVKNYELRLDDFECNPGDILDLREWNPNNNEYTGRVLEKEVTYVGKTKKFLFWSKKDIEKYGYQILALGNKKGIDYIGVGVGAAIFNHENKLLLALRGKEAKNERGKWEIPGGSVELGETFEQAIKREVKEELGIEIEILELLGICDHIIPDEHQHWVSPTYICKIKKGIPRILEPHKCAEIGWFAIEEAEKLSLSIVTRYDISLLKNKYPMKKIA